MKKYIFSGTLLLLALCGLFFFFSPSKSITHTTETTKIKIGGLPVAQGLPFFLALEKGYFTQAGLDIEYVSFESPNQVIDAVLSHQIDMTHTGAPLGIAAIADSKNPGKINIYAVAGGDENHPNDSILVKKNSPLQTFSDLRGKKLGILSSIQWRTIATHILKQENLIVDQDVTLVELAPTLQIQALAQGQIDALLAIQPIPTIALEKGIATEIVSVPTVKYVAAPFYGGAGIINTEFLTKNPVAAKKFLEVMKKATNEIQKDPDVSHLALQKYTGLDEAIASKVPLPIIKLSPNLTQKDIDAAQQLINLFSAVHVVNEKINFSSLLYPKQ